MSIVLETRKSTAAAEDLFVAREGIRFREVSPGRVRIEVEVENRGSRTSRATVLGLESAPLGAFVPWSPLAQAIVAPIRPGRAHVVTVEVERAPVTPLGDFGSVPPALLVAAAAPEREPRGEAGRMALLRDLRGPQRLAPDLLGLLRRGSVHWAGNLNVFVGLRSVERHMAQALRVYPGRLNMAQFVVGSEGMEAYAFELEGNDLSWNASLIDANLVFRRSTLRPATKFALGTWIETTGTMAVMLALEPPRGCEEGKVDVHVRQRSTGKEAVVEFCLDPKAAGPGCYVV